MSSGAVLALEAASRLRGIKKLALYEEPFIVDDSRSTTERDWTKIAEAVRFFLKSVGVPVIFVAVMPLMPMWSKVKAIAHTLLYDRAIVGDNQRGKPLRGDCWASVTIPALVTDGGKSHKWMHHGNRSLASVLPNARYQTLQGQTHMLKLRRMRPYWWSSSKIRSRRGEGRA